MIRLTAVSQQLLAHQLKSPGSFVTVLQRHTGERIRALLTTERQGDRISLTLRAHGTVNSTSLPAKQAETTLKRRAQRWIEDCANGRLECAA